MNAKPTLSEVKERPILMSAPMVRAILDGTKTQTRRVLKIQPVDVLKMKPGYPDTWVCLAQRNPNKGKFFVCRYGKPGERLWVKETALYWMDGTGPTHVAAFAADGYEPQGGERWVPSIFMPRKFSRITLEITDVRCQRLQDITREDAIAEGIERVTSIGPCRAMGWKDYSGGPGFFSPIDSYRSLWDSVNGNKHPWVSNCWVWAISFRRIT